MHFKIQILNTDWSQIGGTLVAWKRITQGSLHLMEKEGWLDYIRTLVRFGFRIGSRCIWFNIGSLLLTGIMPNPALCQHSGFGKYIWTDSRILFM